MNLESIAMVYGTQDLTADFLPGPEGGETRGFGLFGGYPVGGHLGDSKLILTSETELRDRLSKGEYPTRNDELGPAWGENIRDSSGPRLQRQLGGIRVAIPEYSLLGYSFGCGGGYGDPLDRDPEDVVRDVRNDAVSLDRASNIYGVAIDSDTLQIDAEKTENLRAEIREKRLKSANQLTGIGFVKEPGEPAHKIRLLRISEYLEILKNDDDSKAISCIKCGYQFCLQGENYKKFALRNVRELQEMKKLGIGEPITKYQEYICPGCGTLLQVDVWCAAVDTDEPLWDINVKV